MLLQLVASYRNGHLSRKTRVTLKTHLTAQGWAARSSMVACLSNKYKALGSIPVHPPTHPPPPKGKVKRSQSQYFNDWNRLNALDGKEQKDPFSPSKPAVTLKKFWDHKTTKAAEPFKLPWLTHFNTKTPESPSQGCEGKRICSKRKLKDSTLALFPKPPIHANSPSRPLQTHRISIRPTDWESYRLESRLALCPLNVCVVPPTTQRDLL